MNLRKYLADRILFILFYGLIVLLIFSVLFLFNVNFACIWLILILLCLNGLVWFIGDYIRKANFFKEIDKLLLTLDKAYLITEIIKEPSFLEGKLLYDYLYTINKSMLENINIYKYNSDEFREYLELWCHEIKTPLATSKLIIVNNKNKVTSSINDELNRIDNYVEQVLYYSRSSNVNKDYIIKKVVLNDVISNVIKRNKKDLINKKIKIITDVNDTVYSDTKWLEFIINQIILNSIKYSSSNPAIEIKSYKENHKVILLIKDNGIGIKKEEIAKVFDKGFTGTNGRQKYNSTGIGLYLCKKLCIKLDHNITLSSVINEGTTVKLILPINSNINDLR